MEQPPETTDTRNIRTPLIALAITGVVLGGSLIAGAGSFAFAQEATEPPTAQEQATPEATEDATQEATPDTADDTPAEDGTPDDGTAEERERDCPKKAGEDTGGGSTTTSGLTF
jgi:hypothetical protein